MSYDEDPEEFMEQVFELLNESEAYEEPRFFCVGDSPKVFRVSSFGELVIKYLESVGHELVEQFVSFDEDVQVTPRQTAKWLLGRTIRPESPWNEVEIHEVDVI